MQVRAFERYISPSIAFGPFLGLLGARLKINIYALARPACVSKRSLQCYTVLSFIAYVFRKMCVKFVVS